jgi:hypothetical protein
MRRSAAFSGAALWAVLLIIVSLLGWIDYRTGHELNFFVFYFIPVSLAAWKLRLIDSIAVALICSGVWYAVNFSTGHTYSATLYAVWNTLIRLTSFISMAWAVSRIRDLVKQEFEINQELRRSMAEIKVLRGFLPICAQCKKMRRGRPLGSNGSVHSTALQRSAHAWLL